VWACQRCPHLLETNVVHLQVDGVLQFIQQWRYVALTVHRIPEAMGRGRRCPHSWCVGTQCEMQLKLYTDSKDPPYHGNG